MNFSEQDISQVTESIWISVLGIDVKRRPEAVTPNDKEQFLTACVQITGDWEGAVVLQCSSALARTIGAIMYDIEPDAGTTDEVQDALGELTNMIAGNLKALLPGICHLSLPAVVEGLNYKSIAPRSEPISQVAFESQSQPFMVMLLEGNGKQPEEG